MYQITNGNSATLADTGGGNFIGKPNGGAYLGSLVGFDRVDGEQECVLRRFIAVVADDRQEDVQELAKQGLPTFVPWSPPGQEAKQIKYPCPRRDSSRLTLEGRG
jgi:hypothetical protein